MARNQPTLRQQIENTARVATGYADDRAKLWTALLHTLPVVWPGAARDAVVSALRETARCQCGNRMDFDPLSPPSHGLTCERCLST